MKLSRSFFTLFTCGTLFLCLSLIDLSRADDATDKQNKLNGGYYLLHHLCADEAQLPLLLDVKHAPPEIEAFADKISRTAKGMNALLEEIQDKDPAISFDHDPLPAIERDVRDSIADAKQHQLLFGTSNEDFVRALLVSQIEASNYGLNLAKVLSEQETNATRIKSLQQIMLKWKAINAEAVRRLATVS